MRTKHYGEKEGPEKPLTSEKTTGQLWQKFQANNSLFA